MIENPFKLLGLHVGANVFPGGKSEQTEAAQVSGRGYNNNPQGPLHVCYTKNVFLGLKMVKNFH